MKLWIGRIAVAIMLVFAGWFIGSRSATIVHAQAQTAGFTIPSVAGHCKGSIPYAGTQALIFEADNGAIALVNPANGAAVVIPRQ